MTLEERFHKLLFQYSEKKELIDSLWNTINKKYSENHRAYHNLNHLEELFSYYDQYHNKLENPNTIAFSIFYHDVIYNIWKKDNEEKSGLFAIKELSQLFISSDILKTIKEQIIATKTHESKNIDTQFLIDFDLAVLGQSEEIYQKYTQSIRNEYKLVPEFMYKKGRVKVLQHFIDKPFIYKTSIFIDTYEKQAKKNLEKELNTLKNGIK